jgi:hypothetical protein
LNEASSRRRRSISALLFTDPTGFQILCAGMMRSPAWSRLREPESWPEMEPLLAMIRPAGGRSFRKIRISLDSSPKSVLKSCRQHDVRANERSPVSDRDVTHSDLVEIAKRNGDFRKNYGVVVGAILYLRSINAARPRLFWWQALMAAVAGALGFWWR